MSKYSGKLSIFTIADAGSTVRDISADITSVDGLPGDAAMLDTTSFGATAKTKLGGLRDAKVTVKGFFNDTASTGSDAVLSGIVGLSRAFVYGPSGSTTGMRKYSGNALLATYKLSSPVAGMVTFQADFELDGPVTVGTY